MTVETFRACAVIPTYNNPRTIGAVVRDVRRHLEDVIVVDDGSDGEGHRAITALAEHPGVVAVHRPQNGGKGAAVRSGFEAAVERGFTHALQIDADGQHDSSDIPLLLRAARDNPRALVTGNPIFDDSAPRSRLMARRISIFWVNLETGGPVVTDPLCGFRVYPLRAALAAQARGQRMDFDPEIAVRLYWAGAPVINIPTRVRYLSPEEGGVSHFRLIRDNALMSTMHTRLMVELIGRRIRAAVRRP